MACCCGVRRLIKVLSLWSRILFALFDRCEIGVHNTLWSGQSLSWQARLQYFTALHFEHSRTLLSPTELGHRHYMEDVTEPLTRVLQKHHLTFLDKPLITLQQQFRAPKSRPSLDSETKAVYKIPCANCLWCYIGETGRAFNTRKKNISQKTKQQFMPGHAITLLTLKTLLLLVKVTPNADKIIMSLPGQYSILFNKHS